MKNRTIQTRYQALAALASRVLPSPTAIHKVTALMGTRFQQAYESIEAGRKKLIKDNPAPSDSEDAATPAAVLEARTHALDELLELDTPIRKIPETLRLIEADLPKVLKRDGGEGNAEGLASIVVMLGSLYKPGETELALRASEEGDALEVEPD